MAEKVGSYVVDAAGNETPNENDEAMSERHGLKKNEEKKIKNKRQEVADAVLEK